MRVLRVCSHNGCKEIVERGMCPAHRRKSRKEADKRTGRVRGSRWSQLRRAVLRDNPFCVDGRTCRGNATSVEVDHITPLSEGGHPTARSNLQGVCHECHVLKTTEEQQRANGRREG